MIDLLVGGRSWQLLRDDAAERQERPIAIGLGKCLPEVRQRRCADSASAGAGGDWSGQGVSHDDPPC